MPLEEEVRLQLDLELGGIRHILECEAEWGNGDGRPKAAQITGRERTNLEPILSIIEFNSIIVGCISRCQEGGHLTLFHSLVPESCTPPKHTHQLFLKLNFNFNYY